MKKIYLFFILLAVYTTEAQIINIPDANFKNYLLTALLLDTDNNVLGDSTIDVNHNGEIEQNEALLINELYVNGLNISNLTGLEYFTNLIRLRFNNNQVTSIDLHTLNHLQHIQCMNNQLTEISLCGTPATSLWAEGNPNLTYISVKNNVISSFYASRTVSENTPPALPSFMFPESLQTLCYDAGEWDAIPTLAPSVNLVTDCLAECSVLAVENVSNTTMCWIFPNPATSIIAVEAKNPISQITVLNSLGQFVQGYKPTSLSTYATIDISALPAGNYFLEIVSDHIKAIKKLSKL